MAARRTRKISMRYADEKTPLAAEEGTRKPRAGQVTMRALHNFVFYDKETRKPAFPAPEELKSKFWLGCSVEGKVASLSGAAKNLVQAGYWDVQWTDSHFVTMCLKSIIGLHFEQDAHYRNGHPALFLYTRNYAYVLLAPSDYYEPTWKKVLAEWQKYTGKNLTFNWIDLSEPRPSWWESDGVGYEDWDHLQAIVDSAQEPSDNNQDVAQIEPPSFDPILDSNEAQSSTEETVRSKSPGRNTTRTGILTRSASRRLTNGPQVARVGGDKGKGKTRAAGRGQETQAGDRAGKGTQWRTENEPGAGANSEGPTVVARKVVGDKATRGREASQIRNGRGEETVRTGVSEIRDHPAPDLEAANTPSERPGAVSPLGPSPSGTTAPPSAKRTRIESSSPTASQSDLANSPERVDRRHRFANAAEARLHALRGTPSKPALEADSSSRVARVTVTSPSPNASRALSRDPVSFSDTPQALRAPFTQEFSVGPSHANSVIEPPTIGVEEDTEDDMSVSEEEEISGQGERSIRQLSNPPALQSSFPLPTAVPPVLSQPTATNALATGQTNVAGIPGWPAATLNILGPADVVVGKSSSTAMPVVEVPRSPRGQGHNTPDSSKFPTTSSLLRHSVTSNLDGLDLTPDDM